MLIGSASTNRKSNNIKSGNRLNFVPSYDVLGMNTPQYFFYFCFLHENRKINPPQYFLILFY